MTIHDLEWLLFAHSLTLRGQPISALLWEHILDLLDDQLEEIMA